MKNWEALKALNEGRSVWGRDGILIHPSSLNREALFKREAILRYEDGWEIYEEPGHDWAWACRQLVDGKAVRRKFWSEDQFIQTDSFCLVSWRDGSTFALSPPQIRATDWVLAEEQR